MRACTALAPFSPSINNHPFTPSLTCRMRSLVDPMQAANAGTSAPSPGPTPSLIDGSTPDSASNASAATLVLPSWHLAAIASHAVTTVGSERRGWRMRRVAKDLTPSMRSLSGWGGGGGGGGGGGLG